MFPVIKNHFKNIPDFALPHQYLLVSSGQYVFAGQDAVYDAPGG
jgi:hypothetical protein